MADWHALTTDAEHSARGAASTIEMMADWLGAGLDPERSTLFIQSRVPEHAELHLLFSMVTPVGWLERVPTYKEMVEQLGIESPSYGLLGYPLLQSADILMYKAHWVPVGIDQVPHVELTREVARRFNSTWKPVFPEPEAKLTQIPKVPGTDGRKMSKSYGNAIELSDTLRGDHAEDQADGHGSGAEAAHRSRQSRHLPGVRPPPHLHARRPTREAARTGCRTAGIGCLDCKAVLLEHMLPPLAAIRERRQRFAERPKEMLEILHEGSRRAQASRAADHGRGAGRDQAGAMTEVAAPGLTVRVESFEGPLDLLLHLCRTSEVDLARLPIRTVTDQYLAHLESVQFQDLETAGSFMVMAATLIYLKSKLLLPPTGEPGEDELDPRASCLRQELAARLREYARVKALGAWLAAREAEQALLFGRTTAELPPPEEIPLEDLSVHLLDARHQPAHRGAEARSGPAR